MADSDSVCGPDDDPKPDQGGQKSSTGGPVAGLVGPVPVSSQPALQTAASEAAAPEAAAELATTGAEVAEGETVAEIGLADLLGPLLFLLTLSGDTPMPKRLEEKRKVDQKRQQLQSATEDSRRFSSNGPEETTLTCSARPEVSPVPIAPASTETPLYPEQTCSNEIRERLHAEKDAACNSIPGGSMSPKKVSPKRLAEVPCSVILKRIEALKKCLEKRKQMQDECFNKPPDTTAPWYEDAMERAKAHEQPMKDVRNGIENAERLEKTNCAPGHPMADM